MSPDLFFAVKGIVAVVAVTLLIFHMNEEWAGVPNWGRKLRYLTLLGYAFSVTYASIEQHIDGAEINSRNVFGFAVTVLLVVTMVVSIRESRDG
jgi:hypothetical protein